MNCKRLIGTGLAALAIFCGFFASLPADASGSYPKTVNVAAGDRVAGRLLRVGLGRSVVINLGEEVTDVLVSNPEVADAVVRDTRRVFVLGNKSGQASLFLFGAGGVQVASFDLLVEQDTSDLNAILRRIVPNSNISAEALNGNIILSGTAATAADAQRAADVAARFSKSEDKAQAVLNTISVAGKEQVHLKVTVAEVERNVVKQLGVNLAGTIGIGNYVVDFNNRPPFTVNSNVVGQSSLIGGFSAGATEIAAQIEALQRDGVIRTLAEPTLTAISGENASFLAGGEFPIPVAQDDNTITVEFKKFGVGLDFTPVVQSAGNISLRVKTEVSEVTQENVVDLGDISIPGLKVRRAESTVELPSGGTLVLAGLLRETYKQDLNGVPGLMQVPILGALFKSRDFLRQQTELVVFVTPYLAAPVARSKLARPDDNLSPATDANTIFLNRLNKIYRVSGEPAAGTYHGQIGFIYE